MRAKSLLLTGYLELLLERHPALSARVRVLTPRDPARRGAQLSLVFPGVAVGAVHESLRKRGVFCDVRKPHVIRVAPAPLYNSYEDVRYFVEILAAELAKQAGP